MGRSIASRNASLELDVRGRLRYGRAAAEEQSAAVAVDYAYARQSLTATVAKSWFLTIEAGLQSAIAQDSLRSSEDLLRIAQERLREGNGNEQAVAQARATVGSYRETVRQLDLSREQALRALEFLLGRYPAAVIAVASRLAPMPPPVPVGMQSQLLERRPDVIAAERRVAAAFNRVGEAQAAQLPRISLTAGGSSVSSDLFQLKDTSNSIWSFGANLIAPVYQGGVLRAQVEIRSAEQKQAVADYARTGQRAFAKVENALGAEIALREREAILEATIRDSARWSSRRSSIASARSTCAASSRAGSRCIRRARCACGCRASGWRSGSTCTSRSVAASSRRQSVRQFDPTPPYAPESPMPNRGQRNDVSRRRWSRQSLACA